jgi:hypothetical protein
MHSIFPQSCNGPINECILLLVRRKAPKFIEIAFIYTTRFSRSFIEIENLRQHSNASELGTYGVREAPPPNGDVTWDGFA